METTELMQYRSVRLGTCTAVAHARSDGSLLISNPQALGPYPTKLTERLLHWAKERPDQTWLAQRGLDGYWIRLTYKEGLDRVQRIAASLTGRKLSVDRPVMILSGNDLEHALLAVGCMYAGIAYAPLAPAYSLVSRDFGKLRHAMDLLTPGLIFASDAEKFRPALDAVAKADMEVVVHRNQRDGATSFESLLRPDDRALAEAAHDRVDADTVVKFLFTSGSSGMPKAVVNTQRMICSNMAQSAAHFAYLNDEPPVTLDWAPWNHTAGGNHNFNIVMYLGGSLYIDEGKPVPGLIDATVRNLREISPNWYMNVPTGYAALLPRLKQDRQLRENFFRNLKLCMYAGASIEPSVWQAIDDLAIQTTGSKVLFTTSLGSTETAPLGFVADQTMVGAGIIGLPARGMVAKLVGGGPRWEVRLKGPNITPGYWRAPALSTAAFDDEGFYKLGDAVRFVDPEDVNKGFRFDGRMGEDFKLSTGTWVAAGLLRVSLHDALLPWAQGVTLVGANQNFIGAIVFLNIAECRGLLGKPHATLPELCGDPRLRLEIQSRAEVLSRRATGSSVCVKRLYIADWQPTIETGELTDKGAISYSGVITNNMDVIAKIFIEPANAEVICLS